MKGTATVTVTAADGSGVSTTFTVNVYPVLEGFDVSETEIIMPTQAKRQIAITPIPQDALVKPENTPGFGITAPVNQPNGWKYVDYNLTTADTGNGTAFILDLTAYSMGEGLLDIDLGQFGSKQIPLHVGFEYNFANGWNWMSVFSDNISSVKQTMNEMLGDDLVEARTQTGLLYNDPKFGYFGDFTDFDTTAKMYKVKGKAAGTYMLFGDYSYDSAIGLQTGWNWVPYNCEYNQTIALNGSEGDVILSLTKDKTSDVSFATYTNGAWIPANFTLEAGKGYMFYTVGTAELELPNPYDCEQPATIGASQAPARGFAKKVWNYNPRQFSSIMPVIAEIEGIDGDVCTVGAFVGDECRGEGRMVDGKWFITVAGEAGESVSFRIYDKQSDSFIKVAENVKMTGILGSAKAPVRLSAGEANAISEIINHKSQNHTYYNLNGQKVNAAQKGIVVKNGKKVIVK